METNLTAPSNLPVAPGAWGASDTSSKDMLLPNIILVHELSPQAKNGKATAGTIINGVTNELLAARGSKVEIVPIMAYREWEMAELVEQRNGKTKEEYRGRERMTAANEDLPYEYFEDEKPYKRTRVLCFFVLVAGQLDSLPYLLKFKKSNLYSGKKLSTHFQVSSMKGLNPAKQAFGLSCGQQTRNDNTFFVLDIEPVRPTTAEEEMTAYNWYKTLSSAQTKVVEADDLSFPTE